MISVFHTSFYQEFIALRVGNSNMLWFLLLPSSSWQYGVQSRVNVLNMKPMGKNICKIYVCFYDFLRNRLLWFTNDSLVPIPS